MKSLITACVAALALLSGPAQALDVEEFTAQLANAAGRPDADKARDLNRKPAWVTNFMGVEPGMTVADFLSAAGYYAEVFSHAVGRSGKIYLHNYPSALEGRGQRTADAIADRLANSRLANVEQLNRNFDDIGLPANSLDAAMLGLEMHELTNTDDASLAPQFMSAVYGALKPGGVLVIVEHAGNAENNNQPLHRGIEALTVDIAEAAGFELVASSALLRYPSDDRTKVVFDPTIRGSTDTFLLRSQK
jgi:predicted methyltransferase